MRQARQRPQPAAPRTPVSTPFGCTSNTEDEEDLSLEWELRMAAPLVPRTGVVASVVAGAPQSERRERRARARVAVRDDLRAVRGAHEVADPLRRQRRA